MLDRGGLQLEEGVMVVSNKRTGSPFSFRSQYKGVSYTGVDYSLRGLARPEWITA